MTIREFAQEIGVSATTVSHAMHGRGRVSPMTRRMVIERMKELGFTPNVNAQRLSQGRTNLVALDFGAAHDYLSDMYFVGLTRGIQDVLETLGYGVLLSGPGEVLNRWVKTRAVDGVILLDLADAGILRGISAAGTPAVAIGNRPVEGIRGVGSVVIGLGSGARQVARMFVEYGHREIGYLYSGVHEDVLFEFRDELARLGVTLPASRIIRGGYTPQGGAGAFDELMAQPVRPTAIFARTDGLAAGVMSAAHRMGLRIPEELSVVGHDDVAFAELMEPPLTTVRVDCIQLARHAADTLFTLLKDPDSPVTAKTVRTELVMRSSASRIERDSMTPGTRIGKEVTTTTKHA